MNNAKFAYPLDDGSLNRLPKGGDGSHHHGYKVTNGTRRCCLPGKIYSFIQQIRMSTCSVYDAPGIMFCVLEVSRGLTKEVLIFMELTS